MADEEKDEVTELPTDISEPTHHDSLQKEMFKQKMTGRLPPQHDGPRRVREAVDYSPLPWNDFFDEKREVRIGEDTFNVYMKGTSGPLFYLLHGGGYSGLTWSRFANELLSQIDCRVVAPDLRGHGDSHCVDEYDLSRERQVMDVGDIFNKLFGEQKEDLQVCVIGHSMGGALAVHAVAENALKANIVALVVIDVVEGSAMEALSGMVGYLHSRPKKFESAESAVRWCISSGTVRDRRSARISMPSQLKQADGEFIWRIDLAKTEEHWRGWFEGLSATFLRCSPPKLLALAGVDRFDRDLTIGQMQGKFQSCVLPRVGHCVQEDSPEKLAEEIARFAVRFRFAVAKNSTLDSADPTRLGLFRPGMPINM